jgi:hypothetical protein
MTTASRWPLVLATLPLWPIGWVVLFASVSRLVLGYWPSYGHPDPKDLFGPIPFLGLILLTPLPLIAVFGAGVHARDAGRWDWRLLVTLCSFAVFVLWFVVDPGGLGEWVAD